MILQRGVRGDERVQGHGIGLAIVQDMVRSYRGELEVLRVAGTGRRAVRGEVAAGVVEPVRCRRRSTAQALQSGERRGP